MIRYLALLAVVACGPPPNPDPVDTDPFDTDPADTDPPLVEHSSLPIIAEATDLDDDPDVLHVALTAAPHRFRVGDDEVDGYAYNGQVPGPTLRAKRGDLVKVDITNDLDVPTTIHWHGLHVPYAMDGVTWTEAPIAPGETFTATFTLDQVGTYWYHPHFDTARQVDLGLYGVFIVEDPSEPPVDADVVVVADSWGEHGARTPPEGSDHHGLDGAGLVWTFNGALDAALPAEAGQSLRLRWLNASNAGYLDLRGTPGVSWIAGDNGLRAAPSSSAEVLSPGDRAEAIVRLGPSAERVDVNNYSLYGGDVEQDKPVAALPIEPTGDAPAPDPLSWAFSGAAPTPDPGRTDVRLVLQGDATAEAWMINGETFPDVSVPTLAQDAEIILEIRNISPTEHPFHVHGHEFEVLSINGEAPATRLVDDTINVRIRETVRLRLIADNPGFWMAHCHILPHADGGMMTVLEVR